MTLSVVKTWIEGEVLTATDLNAEFVNITNTGFGATTFGDHTVIATGSTTGRALDDRFAEVFNVKDYGAIGNNVNDDTSAIQAAIYAASNAQDSGNRGGIVFFPPGFYRVTDGITIDSGVVICGSGSGSGTGFGNSGGTLLRSVSTSGDIFDVTGQDGVIFEKFAIDSASTRVSGSGIRFRFDGANPHRQGKMRDVKLTGMWNAVLIEGLNDAVIESCTIRETENIGIYIKGFAAVAESGGQNKIANNTIWNSPGHPGQAAIRADHDGVYFIHDNLTLGFDYSFYLAYDKGPSGGFFLHDNQLDQAKISAIRLQQIAADELVGNIKITQNKFTLQGGVVSPTTIIVVNNRHGSSTGPWIENLVISDNIIHTTVSTGTVLVDIQDGEKVRFCNNLINNNGQAGPKGIQIGANVEDLVVLDNDFRDVPSGNYGTIAGGSSKPRIRDMNGILFADLPANSADGSEFYVTDGLKGSDPLAGSGSGTVAVRINNAWVSTASVKQLTATAALDFGSTAAQTSADLTITVTGAAVGDTVALGIPNGAVNANATYTAWVSATNTVTVRFNNYSSGAIDPGSGTFRVDVWDR